MGLKRVLTLSVLLAAGVAAQATLNLKANVQRLGEYTKSRPAAPADDKLLEALALMDRSVEDAKVPGEVERLVRTNRFNSSRHLAGLLYFMLVTDAANLETWFHFMREHETGPFFFPAQLVRLEQLKTKDPSSYKVQAGAAVAWLKSQPENHAFFGPELKGTSIWGMKPRTDFTAGDLAKTVTKGAYVAAASPLPGFAASNIYLALLDANKDSDTTVDEMARIHLRNGKGKTAAANFFELGNRRVNERRFMDAKNYFQRAASLDPENKSYAAALDKANLELLYDGNDEAPAAARAAADPAPAPAAPRMMGTVTGKNVNLRAAPSILGEALDKLSGPLDVPILEVYVAEDASEGVLKKDAVLAADDGSKVDLKSGKAVFIVSDLGSEAILNVTVGEKKYTGKLASDLITPTAGGKWYKIEANNRVGWVFGNFLKEK